MLYRSGERPGLLTPLGFGPHRGFESHSILQIWTSYRSGRTGRTLNPMACAHRRFESCLVLHHSRLYPNGRGSGSRNRTVLVRVEPDAPVRAVTHQVRRPPCHGGEAGSFPAQRASFQCVAQLGRALGSEPRGRRIEACHTDQLHRACSSMIEPTAHNGLMLV
jgi:hypothetical protein